MGLDFNPALRTCGLNPNITNFPRPKIPTFGQIENDRFESLNPARFTNETVLTKLINSNPKIVAILAETGTPVKPNFTELKPLMDNHCTDVQNTVVGITENLPFSLKSKVDIQTLKEAAYLHDIGKILIPQEILNKNGKLNEYETKVMHKHSELGYEILKNTNLNPKTLHLIRNHHQNAKRSGYPFVNNNFRADLDLQILTMADKYSALTEKRVYKDSMTPQQALTIIYSDVKEGKLRPFVFKALVNYANNLKNDNLPV